jgi:hypothetical protein
MVPFGDAWEEMIRLGFGVLDDDRSKIRTSKTIWADPEVRSESEHIDSVLKRKALAIPPQQLWEDAGYSPSQIDRFEGQWAAVPAEILSRFSTQPASNGNAAPAPVPEPAT